jgi:hypothetical protein
VLVALSGLRVVVAARAADATVREGLDDGPNLRALTAAASFVAVGPIVPAGDDAVHGADVLVAITAFTKRGASNTAEAHRGSDETVLVHLATSTGKCACTPIAPPGHDAVDRATVRVAVFGDGVGVAAGALDATVIGSTDDGARLAVSTGAAGLGAVSPAGPAGDNAIDGADVRVARNEGMQIRACDATVAHGLGDSTGLVRVTAAASDGTSAPSAPFGDDAVDGAAVGIAVSGNRVRFATGATNTSVSGGLDDGAALGLGARVARLAAAGPRGPSRDDAIDRADMSIAIL